MIENCPIFNRNNVFIVIPFSIRLVHSGRLSNPVSGSDVLTFGTRCGTRNGVETHIFRVETQRDLAYWSRALVQGSHGVAAIIKEVTCRKCYIILTFLQVFYFLDYIVRHTQMAEKTKKKVHQGWSQ